MTAGGDSVFFIDYTGRIAESANTAIKKQCGGGLAGDEPCVVVKNGPKETSQHQSRVEYGLHKIRSYLWLVPLIHTEFWISAGFALIQPFFPEVASSRGLSAWRYGFVFSAYKFGMLLGSIIAERMLKTQSPTLCYLIGQGGFFVFLIVFGCLYWIQNGEALLATSIAAVIFGGLANNMYLVGMFTVVTTKFEDNSGIFIGFLEFLWGSGNMAGSYLGGHLIDVWAYPLPFFVLGVIAVATFPVIACLRQHLDGDSDSKKPVLTAEEASINYWWLIVDPVFFADMVSLTMVWIILGFNEPTLEPSLSPFNLLPSQTGMVYTVQYGSYACGCIIAGTFSHFKGDGWCMVLGQSMCTIGFLVIAPAKFIASQRQLWNVYACQVLIGFGTSILFICAYSHVLNHVMRLGYPNNIRTNSFVSSCVFSFLVIGAILTPPIAGCVYDVFGYQNACLALSCFLGAWGPFKREKVTERLSKPDEEERKKAALNNP
ncbi:MFS-type transporter SLC18B1-like [Amblyomma americanum]